VHFAVKAAIDPTDVNVHVDARLVPLGFPDAIGAGSHGIEKGVLFRTARGCIVVDTNGDGGGSKLGESKESRWQRDEHRRRLTRCRLVAQAR